MVPWLVFVRNYIYGFLKGSYFDLAHCYEDMGDFNKELSAYGQAMGYDPDDPVIHNNFALAALKTGGFDHAVFHFEQALKLDPRNIRAMTNLATCYIEKKDFTEAEELLRRALAIDGGFAPARQNLEQLLKDQPQLISP